MASDNERSRPGAVEEKDLDEVPPQQSPGLHFRRTHHEQGEETREIGHITLL